MRTPLPLRPDDPAEAGPFRLLGRLASGGMGVVYLARREDRPESLVAMKLMHAEHAQEPVMRERFRAEVAASGRVGLRPSTTTHVARLVEADPEAAMPWLATEFVPGPSLADAVHDGALPASEVVAIALAVAEALESLHAEGLVHGDVKPANIVLGPDGVRLVDLGLARDAGDGLPAAMGSPGWAPPEQHDPEHDGLASDVFGWGMTIAYAAAARHPYGEGSPHELTERMRSGGADLVAVPEPLRPLVAAALRPDPGKRPTAAALAGAVSAVTTTPNEALGAQDSGRTQPFAPDYGGTGALAAPTLVEEADLIPWTEAPDPPRRARDTAVLAALGLVSCLLLGVLLTGALLARPGAVAEDRPAPTPAASSSAPAPRPSPTTTRAAPKASAVPVTGSGARGGNTDKGKAADKAPGKKNGNDKGNGKGSGSAA